MRGAKRRSNPGLYIKELIRKPGYVYILTNTKNGTIYVGVTSDLKKRIREHKNNINEGFTSKYDIKDLVYYEDCGSIENAIIREKQIKGGNRKSKLQLIESKNLERNDLYDEI